MATNFHSELPNSQIHKPKDFDTARKNSLLTKDASNGIKWAKGSYSTVSTVTCQADTAGSLHLQYLCFLSTNDANKYAVYFQVTGLEILSTPFGYTGVIPVNLTASGSGSTAAQVGDALQVALNAHIDFSATDNNAGIVTVTGVTSATHPDGGSTSFDILNIDTEVGSEFLQTDSSGNIKWGAAPGGGGGCSNVFSTITTSPASQTVSASGCTDNLVISQMNNTRITGNTSADTIQIEAIENITFRGDTTSGLESGVEYVFDNSNTRANRFLTAMGAGGSLAPATILKAGIAIPNPGGKVVSFNGYASANGTAEFYISLWRFAVECGASPSENPTGTLVGTIKVTTGGNDNTQCWVAAITSLTYGGNDILVPSFRWTETTLSSCRLVGKLRMY
jgi:hypothetical protein